MDFSEPIDEGDIDFCHQFLKYYMAGSLGAMPKSEIDILVFNLLTQMPDFEGKPNYEIARMLKTTESKVKNLKINASLRYRQSNHKAVIGKFVQNVVNQGKGVHVKDDQVTVGIEDPAVRAEIEYALKKIGFTADYGTNREILKFTTEGLLGVILDNVEMGEKEFVALVSKSMKSKKLHKNILDKSLPMSDRVSAFIGELSEKSGLLGLLGSIAGKVFVGV